MTFCRRVLQARNRGGVRFVLTFGFIDGAANSPRDYSMTRTEIEVTFSLPQMGFVNVGPARPKLLVANGNAADQARLYFDKTRAIGV